MKKYREITEQFFGGQSCDKGETTIPSGDTTSSASNKQSTESQTSTLNKVFMNNNKISANASQVEAEVQLATGQSVENDLSDNSSVEAMLVLYGDKLPKKKKYAIPYLAAKRAGLKVVFIKGNRKVYNAHLEALWKSTKDSKKFTDECMVVPLRPILEKFPDIETYDLDGNQVKLESPNVDSCLVVYDGQHRITVCELHPGEIDVLLALTDFDGKHPLVAIKQMNSFSKNWDSNDLRYSNVASGTTTNKFYEEAEKIKSLHGITTKLAEYAISFKREATKKSDLVEGKDTTLYNDEHAKRGGGILNAIMMCSGGAKEMKKMEFMDAVVNTYDGTKDAEKGDFARKMKICLGRLTPDELYNLKKLITEKNYGELRSKVSAAYKAFCEKHSDEELDEMEKEVDMKVKKYLDKLKNANDEKAAKKPLKSGRVDEILKKNKEIEEQSQKDNIANAKDNVAKAKADSDKAFKKAKEAQDHLDILLGNISAPPVEDDEKK